MSNFTMPKEMAALPNEQQEAIRQILIKNNLLTESGELAKLTPSKSREDIKILAFDYKCMSIRFAEAGAVIACSEIPFGPIAIATCVAVVREIANEICNS